MSAPLRRRPDDAIQRVLEGRDDDEARAVAREADDDVRGRGARHTVLGCAEIPLLLGRLAEADDLVNPAHPLAREAVPHALRPD